MTHSEEFEPAAGSEELSPADQELWERLAARLVHSRAPGLCLGEATLASLEQACSPIPVSSALRRRLEQLGERSAVDLEFAAAVAAHRHRPSLGSYVGFLRGRAALGVAETARQFQVDFQWLSDLEADRLRPPRIPARRLAGLVRRLHGSLEQTEQLLLALVQAPRYLPATGRDSLYRGAPRARAAAPHESDALRENPEYREEVEAVKRLIGELRAAWRGR
jgi:hypothetical protein